MSRMAGFDIIVLIIVGIAAVGGFMRGIVQEVLSLAAWGLALLAIHYLHTPLYEVMGEYLGWSIPVAILAFILLLIVPAAAMKLIARRVGAVSRGSSLLGPIDRVLGFGFGGIKGAVIVVLAFAILALAYDTIWGADGRPDWIVTARTYPVINASTDFLVEMVQERRADLEADGQAGSGAAHPANEVADHEAKS